MCGEVLAISSSHHSPRKYLSGKPNSVSSSIPPRAWWLPQRVPKTQSGLGPSNFPWEGKEEPEKRGGIMKQEVQTDLAMTQTGLQT